MPLEAWWGEVDLPKGSRRLWHIGLLQVAVRRAEGEVIVVWRNTKDLADPTLPPPPTDDVLDGEQERLVVDAETVAIGPTLPDRALVTRPEEPLTLPPGATVSTYVSTPVFVSLRCGRAVWEAPTHRLSDTWFGPNTREGELAYASRTRLKLDADAVLRRPHRAITPVVLSNRGAEPMTVDRIRVPLPRLSLYEGADAIWTSGVRLERERGPESVVVVIPGPPPEAGPGSLLAGPRESGDGNPVSRVFSLLEKMA